MIIKFAHGMAKESETWEVISDIERYSFKMLEKSEMISAPIDFGNEANLKNVAPHFFTAGDFTDSGNVNRKWEFFLYKRGKNDAEKIIVQSPVFILNDDGRTIDRV